jgi:WD40 repeat protein
LISAGDEGSIKLWDAASGEVRATLLEHEGSVLSLAVAPDGKSLASGSADGKVKIWDLETQKTTVTLPHEFWVQSVAFSPDGKWLAAGSGIDSDAGKALAGKIRLWDVHNGKEGPLLTGHDVGEVYSVVFTRDGKTLLSCGGDRTIRWWAMPSGRPIASLRAHERRVFGISLSPDGKTLASASGDNKIKLVDVSSRQVTKTFAGHDTAVTCLAFAPDAKTVVSADAKGLVKLWNVETSEEIEALKAHDMWIASLAISPAGKIMATGKSSYRDILIPPPGQIRLWTMPD